MLRTQINKIKDNKNKYNKNQYNKNRMITKQYKQPNKMKKIEENRKFY